MSWLKTLKQIRTSPKRGRPAPRTGQAARLVLDQLEDRTLLTTDWLPIGPRLIFDGQAQNINNLTTRGSNPVIGAIQAIAPHPTNPNVVFVASVNGGIFKSQDAAADRGGSFFTRTGDFPSLSIGDIAFSPLDTNVVFAGTANTSSAANQGGPLDGLLKTTDAESTTHTWTMLGQTTFIGQNIVRVRPTSLTSASGQVVLVASTNGVYRSVDGGVNWTLISGTGNLPNGTPTDLMGDPTNINRFYAAIPSTAQGVFRSDDGGLNWVAVNLPSGGNRIRLAVGAGGVVYAATMGSQLSNVFRSTNQGTAWTNMGVPSPTIHPGSQAGNNFSIAADPTDPTVVFVGGDRQASPLTNGCNDFTGNHFRGAFGTPTTWTSIDCNGASGGGSPTSPHADSRAMAFDAAGNLLEADDGGLYKLLTPNAAANSRRWVSASNDWAGSPTEFYSIAYDSVNRTYFGGAQDVGPIDNLPFTPFRDWRVVAGSGKGDGGVAAVDNTSQSGRSIHYTTPQNLGCATNSAGQCTGPQYFHRRTFDNTGTLVDGSDNMISLNVANTSPTQNVFQVDATFVNIVEPYVLNNVDPRRMIIGSNFLYESTNQGDMLTSLGGVQETPPGSGNWRAINQVGAVSAIAYGGRRGGVDNVNVLWVGAGGQLWLRTSGTGMPTVVAAYAAAGGGAVQAIQMDPTDWQTAYVLDTSSRVWRTTNAGVVWVEVTGNLCNLANELNAPTQAMDLRTIEVMRRGSDVAVLVGGLGGVYRAVNPGPAAPCTATSQAPRTWIRLGNNGASSIVTDLHYDATGDVIFAAGLGTAVASAFGGSRLAFSDAVLTIDVDSAVNDDPVRLLRIPNTPQWLRVQQDAFFTFEGYAASVAQIIVNVRINGATINIDDTFAGVPVTVNLLAGASHTINISPTARTLNTIQGNITINGGAGNDVLNIFDASANAPFIHTLTSTTLSRALSANISYSSLSAITMDLKDGRVEVRSLAAHTPTAIFTRGTTTSPSLVYFGETTRNLDGILSNVTVFGSAGTAVLIDDEFNASGRNFRFQQDGGGVSYSVGPNTIDILYTTVASVDLFVGTGDNNITVLGTFGGRPTTLHPGSGRNTVDDQSGLLNVTGGGAGPGPDPGPGFGRYTVAAPATLNFISGTLGLNVDSSITGAGTITFNDSVNVTVDGTYNVSGPTRIASTTTVNFNAAAITGQLLLTGGVLGGTGDLTVTDMLTWTDGTMQGSGRTLVNGRLEISGAALKTLDRRRLENAGQGIWSDAGDILAANGGIFTNSPTGVFDVRSDNRFRQGNGARGQFTNAGTFRKSAGSQATTFEVNFNNSGTVDVQTGTLSLLGDGNHSGAFLVEAGTTLGFDGGTHTLTPESMVTTAGTVRFGNAITTVNGSIAAATGSNIAFEAGTHLLGLGSSLAGTATVRFASPTIVTVGGTYNITGLTRSTGGQANFNSDGTTTDLALEGGFLGGTAALTVSGATTWTAGGYNGTGHLHANGGIAMTGAAPKQVANGTLDNAGLAVWNDAGPLQIGQGGTWNNLPGSTLEARNDAVMQGLSGQIGWFLNAGLFRKTSSNGTTQVSVAVTNSGTIQVQTGTVLLDGPLTNLSGTTLTGGTFQVQTMLQIPGADIRTNAANLILDGVSSIISRDAQRTDALANLAVNTADGQVTIRNGRALTTGGGFDNAGLFTMEDNGILNLHGNWNNSGQFQWNGSGDVQSFVATRFDNRAGATFDIRGDAHFRNSGGFNSNFINAGAVRKSAGTGSSNFDATGFHNNGTVEAQTGTLQLNNGGASTGSFSVSAGATLTFGSGTYLLGPSSSVSGEGQVLFTASVGFSSTSIVQGSYAVTGSTRVVAIFNLSSTTVSFFSAAPITTGDLTLVGGPAYFGTDATATSLTLQQGGPTGPSLDLDGPGTVTVSGLITWTGGVMNGLGRTIALGGIVISGPDGKGLVNRTLVNAGTATWTGADFRLIGGTLTNPAGAVFDVQTDAPISSIGDPGVINNAGTLRKSAGTGTTTIEAFLSNTGAVEVQTGTLRLVQNSTSSGGITIQAGAGLEFAAGTFRLTDTAVIAGDGRVRFNNGITSLTGSYNVGDTVIDAGTAEFAADASTGTLTLNGGTLTGAGTLTVTGQTTWTGGSMSGLGRTVALGGLEISGVNSKALLTRALDNYGDAIWTGGTILIDSDAPFVNYEEASFDIRTDAVFIQSGGGPAPIFTNLGTFRKSAGVGVSEFSSVALSNSGTVEVQVGTLRLGGGGESTGSFTVAAGASLEFAGGDHLLTETATLTGDGRVAITGGTVYLAGDLTVAGGEVLTVGQRGTFTVAGAFTQSGGSTALAGGTLVVGSGLFLVGGTLSGSGQIIGDVFNSAAIVVGDVATIGTLTVTGNYTQTADGTLALKLGGTGGGQFDRLLVSGTAALAGTLRITLIAGYMPAAGDTLRVLVAGTLTGTFDTLDGDGPLFDPLYDGTGLTMRRP